MEFAKVGSTQMLLLVLGSIIMFGVPLLIAIIWKLKKKEPITTILAGAGTFLLFALILEKPIQNALIFPSTMGLPDHAAAQFINARPLLLVLLTALFPGVFEETGRLVAYKTLLRNKKNRETSISHGIGHGGFEVMLLMGVTYVTYLSYALMINSGSFGTILEQVKVSAPAQVDQVYAVAEQLAAFSFGDLALNIVERIFAVMFHIGGSILVFYACKDKKKFWLYPLAIVLHTLMDGMAALSYFGIIVISPWMLEVFVMISGSLTFFGAYLLLYKKDEDRRAGEKPSPAEA
ncbi:MAG: YhfC family intramembrane metalloprotease [Lachnospiraceae bacterium]|nr:YhfC family intramembrane metalloprotease [Lachnospiraceae bacterium]